VTEGRDLVRRLIAKSDVLVENFKVGDLARHNLDYRSLAPEFPRLIYCSITGFGQTGPYAPQAGYDYLAQAMGGLMSITGESDGAPAKVGVGIADIMTGMYACSAILAALHHREQTGRGQYIDMALLDCQVAMLSYAGQYFLTSGKSPERPGNGHPTIVPYHTFATTDGWMVLAVGNDSQFRKFCDFAGRSELAEDDRFRTNALRVRNRAALMEILNRVMAMRTTKAWVDGLTTLGVPSGPINTIDETFADTQVRHRGMAVEMNHPLTPGPLALIGNPIKMSETPPTYRHAPPVLGQHTNEVLSEVLGLSEALVSELRQKGVV
jgi:crotonobetainyl-CoA:carnitine CoA-transferase CaiB-like acyl-CoA transferase